MNGIDLKTIVLGMVQTNCYIISNPQTKEAIVIDPADDAIKIEQYLKSNDLVCRGILLTHGHFDHIMAGDKLRQSVNAPVHAHENELTLLRDTKLNASAHFRRECSLEPDVLLRDQEVLKLAGFNIKVIHTPGHTSGGVCYYVSQGTCLANSTCTPDNDTDKLNNGEHGMLFSGDTLFYESIGRTDLPTGSHNQLVDSIQNRLMILEDELQVYPGHGKPTTIGHERNHNIYLNSDHFYS